MRFLPSHAPGMRIGLFGGSFNPPHQGHLLVSHLALTRLRLDRMWWLVTPGNPLKDSAYLAPLDWRISHARALTRDPRIIVTDIEKKIGTQFTSDTLSFLRARCGGVRFVWIMGADNLLEFHRWRHWQEIIRLMPVAIIDRPGATWNVSAAKVVKYFARSRISEAQAPMLAEMIPPAFVVIHGPRSGSSSTLSRAQAQHGKFWSQQE